MDYPTIEQIVGNTPLVRLQRLAPEGVTVLGKMEGNNPASSVKDRAAAWMIQKAEEQGLIKPGDRLIEATSGNTGIALAMVCAIKGYHMTLIMPDNLSVERRAAMKAYGAELILVSNGMEGARDLAEELERQGKGRILNQFANSNNPLAHYESTGPEIWRDTAGQITHFVSSMGTTGTIMGCSRYLKSKTPTFRSSGFSRVMATTFPAFVAGLPNTCLAFTSQSVSIAYWIFRKPRPRKRPASWLRRKAFFAASVLGVRWPVRCVWPRKILVQP